MSESLQDLPVEWRTGHRLRVQNDLNQSWSNASKSMTEMQNGRFKRPFYLGDCGRGERIRTSGLYVPNVALYLAKLHPDGGYAMNLREKSYVLRSKE